MMLHKTADSLNLLPRSGNNMSIALASTMLPTRNVTGVNGAYLLIQL